jgi:hypothetical protein
MAQSSCPKCGAHSFEIKEHSPSGSNFKVYLLQCSAFNCGAVVGTMDFHNTAAILANQEKQIAEVAVQANVAAINTSSIIDAINRLFRHFQIR